MEKCMTTAISVIVPFYKELDLIERAISSVVDQRLPPDTAVDVIVGNDGKLSEAEIRAALSESSSKVTRIVKNLRERGAGNARNAALDLASGELIAFLDADDYWHPTKLQKQIRLIDQGATFVAGAYQFEGSGKTIYPPARVVSTSDLLKNLRVGTSTVLLRRDFLAADRFRNFRFSQDTELWARLAGKAGFAFSSVPEVVTIYAPSLRTANKFEQLLAFGEVVRAFPLGLRERAEIYSRYVARGVMTHYLRR